MKETINVNIGTQSFTLDYDAYQTLRTYLEDVEARLGADDQEVMSDIENRIAEIFREKTPSPMMVVTIRTVRSAIEQMGRPEEFGEPRSTADSKEQKSQPIYTTFEERRFRRPLNDRVVGGVCAGLANYFGVDTLLMRVIALLLFCCAGLSLWVYVILWIVMPSEETHKLDINKQKR